MMLEATSSAAGEAAGAAVLVAHKRQLQTLIKALDERSWRKRQAIASIDGGGDLMAVAVEPAGASAIERHVQSGAAASAEPIPEALARMLDDGAVQWASGTSVGGAASAATATAAQPPPPRQPAPTNGARKERKRKKAAAASDEDWRQTLFHWRGELRYAPPAPPAVPVGTLTWSGSWVGRAASFDPPSSDEFAASPNTFELTSSVQAERTEGIGHGPPATECLRASDGVLPAWPYMLCGLCGGFTGEYLLDDGDGLKPTQDELHQFRVACLSPDEGTPMGTVVAAVGSTPFGRFVSLGTLSRRGAKGATATERALVLTLVRRYVSRDDVRSRWLSPLAVPLPKLLTSRALIAEPWRALELEQFAPPPLVARDGEAGGSPDAEAIEWVVELPDPGGADDAWAVAAEPEGRDAYRLTNRNGQPATSYVHAGAHHQVVQRTAASFNPLDVRRWRYARNRVSRTAANQAPRAPPARRCALPTDGQLCSKFGGGVDHDELNHNLDLDRADA